MNANAKQWVAALRSGEFKQGTECLRSVDDNYCCLGVACELFSKATGELEAEYSNFSQEYRYGDKAAILPADVKDWLGLADEEGSYGGTLEDHTLTGLNDIGKSFAEIADVIESEPPGLFVETH